MNSIVSFFSLLLESPLLLFIIEFLCFSAKLYLLSFLIVKGFKSGKIMRPLLYLGIILVSGVVVDSSWLLRFIQKYYIITIDFRLVLFLICIAWAFNIFHYLAMGFFIESLSEKKYTIKLHQIILSLISIPFIFYFIFIAFFHFNFITQEGRAFDLQVICWAQYLSQILVPPSIYFTMKKLYVGNLPKILKQQLIIFINYFLIPSTFIHFFEMFSFFSVFTRHALVNSLSNSIMTFGLFYAIIKVMGIRFLNFQQHIPAKPRTNVMDDVDSVFEQLSSVTNVKELRHIIQIFFKNAFALHFTRTNLYFRPLHTSCVRKREPALTLAELIVEEYVNGEEHTTIQEVLKQQKIIIYDDIEFNNFYENNETNHQLLHFMDRIDADIFLPMYDGDTVIAYIIIGRPARYDTLFNNSERKEMLTFVRYLGTIINLLNNRNLIELVQSEKELQEELYLKHQELNQYRESIRSFMHDNKNRKIGLVFYRNKRFTFGNKEAEELTGINFNATDGHPLTKEIKQLVQHVQEYKSNQSRLIKDGSRSLVFSAFPHTEQDSIIIMIYYPEIADVLKGIEQLHNPSEWDYLLYLETTKSGKLINQLIPSSKRTFLNFKIELLKMALSRRTLLLQMPDEDLMPTVEILHHISFREQLHVLKLSGPATSSSLAISLFGINPLLVQKDDHQISLLEKLNEGTLFIQNIHFLDLESQRHLAEYIKCGVFRLYKSDQRSTSNVRIMCSTNQNLSRLVQENRFLKELYDELQPTTLVMPSLTTLPEEDLNELVEGFSDQAIASPLNNLLELSPKEKSKIIQSKPLSLRELKETIFSILSNKSKQSNIYEETYFDPSYALADPVLVEAAKMGKKALQDARIMGLLWNKFKNQSKIAAFLGVNRSSVNKRCKDYNLQ